MDGRTWDGEYAADVAHTRVGNALVSTVFLGIDHNSGGGNEPILWETMVFDLPDGHPFDGYYAQYSSLAEAKDGHNKIVLKLKIMLGA